MITLLQLYIKYSIKYSIKYVNFQVLAILIFLSTECLNSLQCFWSIKNIFRNFHGGMQSLHNFILSSYTVTYTVISCYISNVLFTLNFLSQTIFTINQSINQSRTCIAPFRTSGPFVWGGKRLFHKTELRKLS